MCLHAGHRRVLGGKILGALPEEGATFLSPSRGGEPSMDPQVPQTTFLMVSQISFQRSLDFRRVLVVNLLWIENLEVCRSISAVTLEIAPNPAQKGPNHLSSKTLPNRGSHSGSSQVSSILGSNFGSSHFGASIRSQFGTSRRDSISGTFENSKKFEAVS